MNSLPDDNRYVIEILDIAMNVIDMMASDHQEYYSPSTIARQFHINRSRAFRIMKTLERRGYVDYEPRVEAYRLGMKFLSFSRNIRDRLSLRSEGEQILKNLAEETGDSSYLMVPAGDKAIVIERFSGDNMLQVSAPIGTTIPYHVGAATKAILAFLPDDQREDVLDKMEFNQFTSQSITEKRKFIETLHEIRANGFSVDEQDFELGAYAFGAPVFDHDGRLVAGVSVSTPAARYSPARRTVLINLVIQAGRDLSSKLGYQEPLNQG